MRFAWCWLHRAIQNLVVDFELHFYYLGDAVSDIRRERGEECLQNCGIDDTDGLVGHISVGDDVEVALQTLGNNGTTTSGWAHRRAQHKVHNREPRLFFVFAVIPTTEVHKLTHKLNGRLCAVFLLLGHI